jgi:hypothetical protein
MIHSQRNSYHVLASPTATYATNNTSPIYVDTQPTTGAQPNYLTIVVGTELHTNAVLTSFNAVESDDTVASNFATFTGFVAGTDYTASDATGSTNGGAEAVLDIDLRGRKRYVGIVPVADNTTYNSIAAFAILGRYGEDPSTVADVHVKG